MGEALIVRRGGTGGGGLQNTDAILIVTAPVGATVTATKSSTTLTPTMWVQNADNTLDTAIFSVPSSTFDANNWTVTATRGAISATKTIVINAAYAYNLVLGYTLYLLKDGVEENGYSFSNSITYISSSRKGNVTSQSGYIQLTAVNGYTMVWSTDSKVNLTGYNTLYARIRLTSSVTASGLTAKLRGASLFPLTDAHPNTGSAATLAGYINEYANVTSTGDKTLQVDVSALSGGNYINLSVGANGSSNGTVYAYDIYLE